MLSSSRDRVVQEPHSPVQTILSGFFLKKGLSTASFWKPRYFVLRDDNILTYADSKESSKIRQIDLSHVIWIENDDENVCYLRQHLAGLAMKTGNDNARVWHFCFVDNEQRNQWKNALGKCIKYNAIHFVDNKAKLDKINRAQHRLLHTALRLKQHLHLKTRRHKLKTYRNCFVSEIAVQKMMQLELAKTVDEAIALGNQFIGSGIIRHCCELDADRSKMSKSFFNGQFWYAFIDEDEKPHKCLMDFESVLHDRVCEQDMFNLIRRCQSDTTKIEQLYEKLCRDHPTHANHVKYEQWLNVVGARDASLMHFMQRLVFYALPRKSKAFAKYAQLMDYTRQNAMVIEEKKQSRRASTPATSACSFSAASAALLSGQRQQRSNSAVAVLHEVPVSRHNVALFAGLPLHSNDDDGDGDDDNKIDHEQQNMHINDCYLYRLMTESPTQCKHAMAVLAQQQHHRYTLYELEEFLGLLFYKCCPATFEQKRKAHKMPRPWSNKVCADAIASNTDAEDAIAIDINELDIAAIMDECMLEMEWSTSSVSPSNTTTTTPAQYPPTLTLTHSRKSIDIEQETKAEQSRDLTQDFRCIDAFDRIVTARDHAFPAHLSMFNVLMCVWLIYRSHCEHLAHHHRYKLHCLTYLIHKIIKQFFMQLHVRSHLSEFIRCLHAFAVADEQRHMFEMALNALRDSGGNGWSQKARIIDWLVEHHWTQSYHQHRHKHSKPFGNIDLYLRRELQSCDQRLNQLYAEWSHDAYFARIDALIKIKHGNIVFRQDASCVLRRKWFNIHTLAMQPTAMVTAADLEASACHRVGAHLRRTLQFDLKCAFVIRQIAKSLSAPFLQTVTQIFAHCEHTEIYAMPVKSTENIEKELHCMLEKNIKFPKCASIRDYLSCVVSFKRIRDMLHGYRVLSEYATRGTDLSIVHIENCVTVHRLNARNVFDNLKLIAIHCVFECGHQRLIVELIFCLYDALQLYATKQCMTDAFAKLIDEEIVYEIVQATSSSKEHSDYDWKIDKYRNIQSAFADKQTGNDE